jgi:glucokinase
MTAADPLLVADVGGTHTRLALIRAGGIDATTVRRLRNAEFKGLRAVLARYLADLAPSLAGGNPAAICAAVAGPVQAGVGHLSNLDWTVSEAELAAAIGGGRAVLVNDLQAQGHALGRIDSAALRPLILAPALPDDPPPVRLVIGVGTGFNAAAVFQTATGRLVAASEAGHASLPASDPQAMALAAHLAATRPHACIEEALSGRGLAAIDAFLAGAGAGAARDTGAVLAAAAAGEARAEAAVAAFARLLGTVAGDLALVHLPFGGIYLIGGMARSVAGPLAGPDFAAAFRAKGRLSAMMERFPVWLIEDDYAALTGCAALLAEGGA